MNFESGDWSLTLLTVLSSAIRRGTPIAFTAMGEAVSERAGVMNLGVEGIMLVGAVVSVAVEVEFQSALLGVCAAVMAGILMALLHGLLVIQLRANQVVSGFALTMLGTGVSGFFGRPYVGVKVEGFSESALGHLQEIPIIGPVFLAQDWLVYVSVALSLVLWVFLHRTRLGLELRATGEDDNVAFERGVPVTAIRFAAVGIGGGCAGFAGAHLALAYTHVWAERMTAGQGWIAVGLVIVAGWSPLRSLFIAWGFGAIGALHPQLQAIGYDMSPYLVSLLPYLVAILALAVTTLAARRQGEQGPGSLGKDV